MCFPTLEDLRLHLVRLFPSIPGATMFGCAWVASGCCFVIS